MKTILITVSFIFLSACTTLTEAEKEQRAYERAEQRAEHADWVSRCRAAGLQPVWVENQLSNRRCMDRSDFREFMNEMMRNTY